MNNFLKPSITGNVCGVKSGVLIAKLPRAALGDLCEVTVENGMGCLCEVVGFKEDNIFLASFDKLSGVYPGAPVKTAGKQAQCNFLCDYKHQVIDPFGKGLDDYRKPSSNVLLPLIASPPPALKRISITETMITGISSIDGFCTIGHGQRIGLFSGAGVGKSTLLSMLARGASVDHTVIALIGERGREVRDFIESAKLYETDTPSTIVVATSDEPASRRIAAAQSATAIAEYYRAQGKRVLLLVDSLTRWARAVRENSLAIGELPVRQGYTPSVFTELPKLLERAGNDEHGSITAIYTVLTNNELEIDPLGEEIKSLLDGHIMLRQQVALEGVRPAIDLTESVSRLFNRLHDEAYQEQVTTLKRIIARIKQDRDLVLLGGTPDSELEKALKHSDKIKSFLSQSEFEKRSYEDTINRVGEIYRGFV